MKFVVACTVLCLAASLYGVDAIKCWACTSQEHPWCAEPDLFNETMKNDPSYWKECLPTFGDTEVCLKMVTTDESGLEVIGRTCTYWAFADTPCNFYKAQGAKIKPECTSCYSSFCNAAPHGVVPVGALIISMLMLMNIFQF